MDQTNNDIQGEYTESSASKTQRQAEEAAGTAADKGTGNDSANEGIILSKIEELGSLLDRVRGKVDMNRFSEAFRNLARKLEA